MDSPSAPQTSLPAPVKSDGQTLVSILKALFERWALWTPAIGGALVLIHFYRIGYVPSLSFADLGTVLGVLLLMSVLGLVAMLVMWAWPFIIMGFWIEGGLLRGPPRPLPRHESGLSDRAYAAKARRRLRGRHPEDRKLALRASFAAGSLSSFVSAAVASALCYLIAIVAVYTIKPAYTASAILVLLVFFASTEFALIFFIDRPCLRRRLRWLRKAKGQWWLLFLIYMGAWPLLILPFLYAGDTFLLQHWLQLVLTLLILSVIHWAWFVTWQVEKPVVWLFRVGGFAFLLLVSGLPWRMVDMAAEALGFGMLRNVDLVLTSRGCEIVHAAWPERICTPDHRGKAAAGAYRLERVDMLTRIGSHYYLAPAGGIDDDTLPRITLPAEDVMSWVRTKTRSALP